MRINGHMGRKSTYMGVSINAKGGDCWAIGLDSWLSLMLTLGE
jgi:hypothetical protein